MLNKIKDYLELVRFSHTLFALPFALASMFLASQGLPPFKIWIIILICMVSARNVAMAFNRLVDAKIDAKNPRTANRHIPSGLISKSGAITFILINCLIFITTTYFLNDLAFYLSIPTLLFLMSYSLWKRFSWGCHLFLGFAIGISPMGAWVAVTGKIELIPALLCLMLSLWIAGFDVIYATADVKSDQEEGLHSIPVRFGTKKSLVITQVLHLLMLVVAFSFGYLAQMELYWWFSLSIITGILVYINYFRKSDSLDSLNADFFLANIFISSLVLISIVLEVYL